MSSPQDVAFGRLAIARGLVAREVLRQLNAQLPPGRSLAELMVERRLLTPQQAQQLWLELSGSGQIPGEAETWAAPEARPAPALSDSTSTVGVGPLSASGQGALPVVGERIDGRFEVVSILGKGGMGAVYRARDLQLKVEVAVKVLLPGTDAGGTAVERFVREAQAMGKVRHPGIVRISAAGLHGGLPYAAMDLVEGSDLRSRVKQEGPLPIDEAVDLIEQCARAIDHCHGKGILHRDLKPANVLIRAEDGRPFVTDFGLVRDADAERLTKTGQMLGTPSYMAPEQADGDVAAMDERTDVYGLGATLYELLVGEPPFRGDGMQVIKKVLLDAPVPPRERREEVSADLDAVCRKALAKDPVQRYPTAAALADDLAAIRTGAPVTVRAPTRKELLRWRAKRGDRRARTELALRVVLPLAVVAAPVIVYILGLIRTDDVKILRERVDQVVASAHDDPLLLDRDAAKAARHQLLGLLRAAAAVQKAKVSTEELTEEDFERFQSWLERGPVAEAISEEQAAATHRLMRRYAVQAGWKAPWEQIGPEAEDHLFVALKYLAWRRPEQTVDVDLLASAEKSLTRAADGGEPAIKAAVAEVRQRIRAAEEDLRRHFRAGTRKRGSLWDTDAWTKRAVSREALQERNRDLLAALPVLARRPAEEVVREIAPRLKGVSDDAWGGKQVYQDIRSWVLRRLVPVLDDPAILKTELTALLTALASRVKEARIAHSSVQPIMQLITQLGRYLDWSSERFRRYLIDIALLHVEDRFAKGKLPEPAAIELMPRLGYLPTHDNLRPVITKVYPLLVKHAKAVHTGDAWLNVAAVDESIHQKRPKVDRWVWLYAIALGEGDQRSALVKGPRPPGVPKRPLTRPISDGWTSFVRYRMAHLAAPFARNSNDMARYRVAAGILHRLWREKATMPRTNEQLGFLRHTARTLWRYHLEVGDPERAKDVGTILTEAEALAWRFLKRAVEGGGKKRQEAEGTMYDMDHTLDTDKNEYDWVNVQIARLDMFWPKRLAAATTFYEAAQEKLRGLRGRPSSRLERYFLIRGVHFGGAKELKRADARSGPLLEAANRAIERSAGSTFVRRLQNAKEEAVIIQARVALARGDADTVLKTFREVRGWKKIGKRAWGQNRWWTEFVLPLTCLELLKQKRRADVDWVLKHIKQAEKMHPAWKPLFEALGGR